MEPKLPTAHTSLALIAFTPKRLSLTTSARALPGRATTAATVAASAARCRLRPPPWRVSRNQFATHHGSGRGVNRARDARRGPADGVLDGRESSPVWGRSGRHAGR